MIDFQFMSNGGERSDFLRVLRHDLRTPINHVIGYSELLLEDLEDGDEALIRDDLLKILGSGRELLALVNESLSVNEAEIGPSDLERMGTQLRSPLNAIIGYSELICEDLDVSAESTVVADLRRIQTAGRQLLPMVNAVLDLWADSHAPQREPLPAHTTADHIPDLPLSPFDDDALLDVADGLILVVDDNSTNRDILARRLTKLGYQVSTAVNGLEALELLGEKRFDLVLLDIMMPVMNGYVVLDRMKADSELRNIPVIVLSASDEMQSAVRSIQRGAEDYLTKPFDPILLKARIRSSLQKKRWRDQEEIYRRQIEEERRRADELLHVILPEEIVTELKQTQQVVPRRYENVAVMFCDIVSFTDYCDKRTPQEVMPELQQLIEAFETIALEHELDKIKTIGDSFMAAAGLLRPTECPVTSCIKAGLAMFQAAIHHPAGWNLRIGIHVGPVVGGLLGHRQYLFDLFGDTVNTAARMESYGQPGSISLSAKAWERIATKAEGQSLGLIRVKGKGEMEMFRFESFREQARSPVCVP
jgi:CheY-like chemotaxis protein